MGGYPPWREYQTDFRARYGTGALVPVLDLIADSGLGLPAGYLGSGRERGTRQISERDHKLLNLVQQATVTGGEIVLTEKLIEHLASAPVDPQRLPVRTEIGFTIRACSLDDLNAGRFQLDVTGTPRPASSMIARHAHLIPEPDLAEIRRTFDTPEPDTTTAQLSFVPRWRRDENVARSIRLAPSVISIAEYHAPDADSIALADLAVTAEGADLHLIQISTGKRVIPLVASALEAATHSPPLARFLSEVATACFPVYSAFDFGAANTLPYLPRVRYRRTILAPARWLLNADQLPGHETDQSTWNAELAAWRERWHVPDHVAIADHDRVQPIDLRHRVHRMLLRSRIERRGRLELHECAAPGELGWLGRAHEILLIMHRPRTAAPRARRIKMVPPPVTGADLHLPAASRIVALRLHAHPDRFDDIIADHLAALAASCDSTVANWWFHRHRDLSDHRASQHLAIFLHLRGVEHFAATAALAASWAERLHRDHLASRLAFTDWQPPTGRYGHGPALDAALRAFAADSAAAVAQLRAARISGLAPQALAAASFVDLAAALAGDPVVGRDWLLRETSPSSGRLDRGLRDQALGLADRLGPLKGTPAGQARSHQRPGTAAASAPPACRRRFPRSRTRHGSPRPSHSPATASPR
ncbi:MAG: hypothetical protein AUG49_22705 [Catenulispora sp. 13_1_20CM_3_70_7]|nr:MAG: hypothetical protein AUG49_22705 [Catenulispora sp. 13_1_20CM_3_70_7]